MKKLMLALCLSFPIFAYPAEPQRINFNEYHKKIEEMASECTSKSMPHFNGFCLSQKYDDSTERSITVALQVTSFEYFYQKCEHSDFPNVKDLLARTLNLEEAKRFFEEMKPQKEALETYSNYFDYCKTKDENNLAISNKLKWFEYMINKYSKNVKNKDSGDNKPMLQSTSNQPAISATTNNITGSFEFLEGTFKVQLECISEQDCVWTESSNSPPNPPFKASQKLGGVQLTEKISTASASLKYMIDKKDQKNLNRDGEMLIKKLYSVLSSNPVISKCWDLDSKRPTFKLACTMSNIPPGSPPLYLFILTPTNCREADAFCGYAIMPMQRVK